MKRIAVYYDTEKKDEDGKWQRGETVLEFDVSQTVRLSLAHGMNASRSKYIPDIEKLIDSAERLKGRCYIKGSIKFFEVVRA